MINDKRLQEQIEQATRTINFLTSIITVLGVVLALDIGLGTYLTYAFGVAPARDAVEKLENNMDERVSAYLEDERLNRINFALDSLQSKTEMKRRRSLHFLSNESIALLY